MPKEIFAMLLAMGLIEATTSHEIAKIVLRSYLGGKVPQAEADIIAAIKARAAADSNPPNATPVVPAAPVATPASPANPPFANVLPTATPTGPTAIEERARQKDIRSAGALLEVDASLIDQAIEGGLSVDAFRAQAINWLAEHKKAINVGGGAGGSVRVTGSEVDNFAVAAEQGLALKIPGGVDRYVREYKAQPSQAAMDMSRKDMVGIAAECLRISGHRGVERMSREAIAKLALSMPSGRDQVFIPGATGGFNTSGSFANLVLNASHKSLARGFDEANTTYQVWATRGPNLTDFKVSNIIKFGEASDVEAIPEGQGPNENRMSDDKEVISLDRYGSKFSYTFQMMLNDELGALDTVPFRMGNACRRKLNRLVYAVINANPTMSDGYALFDATNHPVNDVATGLAPSTAQLTTMFKNMRLVKGLNTEVVLNLGPKYLLVPVALEIPSRQLLQSMGEIADNKSSAVIQPFHGQIQVVSDAELDSNSSVKWYVTADPSQIDSIQYRFLEGQETPVQTSWYDPEKATRHIMVEQCFGVAAVEWRGIARNAGTGG